MGILHLTLLASLQSEIFFVDLNLKWKLVKFHSERLTGAASYTANDAASDPYLVYDRVDLTRKERDSAQASEHPIYA